MSDPLVSVVMPAYNAAPFVGLALSSILSQSYRNLEFICIDDGSTDATPDIVAEHARNDRRIKFYSRSNRGLVATLNEGLSYATGAFVARMDADDIAYEHRISRQVAFLHEHPDVDLLGTRVDYLYADGRVVRKDVLPSGPDAIAVEGMFHCVFIHPSVMFRRARPGALPWRYDPGYPYCEDFELWSRMLRRSRAAILPQPGLAWRQGHASVRTTKLRQMTLDSLRVVGDNLRHRNIPVDLGCLRPFLEAARPLAREDCDRASVALTELRAARTHFGAAAKAYDRGVATFLSNTLRSAAAAGHPRQLIACFPDDARRDLPITERVKTRLLSTFPPPLARGLVERMQHLHRSMSGFPVASLHEVSHPVSELLRKQA